MKTFFVITGLLASLATGRAGLLDQLQALATTNKSILTTSNLAGLSQEQMIQGLKEALAKGVQSAVTNLGRSDGFLTNLNVKIPLPGKLKSVEKALRTIKQEKLADDFVNTMNHAAEQAVPQAASVFSDSIKQMSIADARNILTGTNNAATEYFRRTTQTNLYAKFLPIVKIATEKVGVTAAYKNMMSKAGVSSSVSGLLGSTGLVKPEDMDIDAYVTQKAMDGLFTMVAEQEKQIRQNPVARTTDLLKQVFGAAAK